MRYHKIQLCTLLSHNDLLNPTEIRNDLHSCSLITPLQLVVLHAIHVYIAQTSKHHCCLWLAKAGGILSGYEFIYSLSATQNILATEVNYGSIGSRPSWFVFVRSNVWAMAA